jgi:hypothetical protein
VPAPVLAPAPGSSGMRGGRGGGRGMGPSGRGMGRPGRGMGRPGRGMGRWGWDRHRGRSWGPALHNVNYTYPYLTNPYTYPYYDTSYSYPKTNWCGMYDSCSSNVDVLEPGPKTELAQCPYGYEDQGFRAHANANSGNEKYLRVCMAT